MKKSSKQPAGQAITRLARLAVLAVLTACAGCVSSSQLARDQAPHPVFDPAGFFSGHTEGRGLLKIAFHRTEPTLVEGEGHVDADGTLILDQSVRKGDASATHRTWRLRNLGAGRYAGTLSDASGPVTGDVEGNRLHLAFRMKGGLQAQQWLYLERGGRVADNVMVVSKFGLPVARLTETITRR